MHGSKLSHNHTSRSLKRWTDDSQLIATYLHLRQQFACGRRRNEDMAAVRVDEALGRAFLEQGKQRVVVAVDVQQPNLREEPGL